MRDKGVNRIFIIGFMVIFYIIIGTSSIEAKPREGYDKPLGIYEGETGLKIVSFSENWSSEESLETVYNELLQNFHGKEIHYLSHIYIYPDSPEGVAGYYYDDFDFDENGRYEYKDGRYIEIFNGDEYTDISQMARVLSHEYGHHFTFYYLLTKENKHFSQWQETEYAKIRGLLNYPQVKYFRPEDLNYIHEWEVTEIAAEDYVQLFGSKLAKASIDYKDVEERVEEGIDEYYYYSDSFNLLPQENLDLPLAADIEGLYLYWLGLAGYTTKAPSLPQKPQIELVETETILDEHKQYHFYWNEINTEKENTPQKVYEYTLVAYPKEDNNFPQAIKTVYSGEEMSAVVGSALHSNGDGSANVIFDDYTGEYELRLFIKDSKGFIYSSEPKKFIFNQAAEEIGVDFTDFHEEHWAYDYVNKLVKNDIIHGYPDGTFGAEREVTRAEYLSMLLRTIKNMDVQPKEEGDHWFKKQGYFDMAQELGLVTIEDYGEDYTDFILDDPITREEMAFMAGRLVNLSTMTRDSSYKAQFLDEEELGYIKEINIASKYGIINGYPDGSFRPKRRANRAEAAKIIARVLDVTDGRISNAGEWVE